MKKHRALWRLAGVTLLCAAPYAILPPLCEIAPEGMVWAVSFLLCYLAVPVSALLAPYWIARAGIPAIAAWPWPVLCALILPLWGMQPGWSVLALGALIALVSAVAGEERRKRLQTPPKGRSKRR